MPEPITMASKVFLSIPPELICMRNESAGIRTYGLILFITIEDRNAVHNFYGKFSKLISNSTTKYNFKIRLNLPAILF
jgi:hypothetical protein